MAEVDLGSALGLLEVVLNFADPTLAKQVDPYIEQVKTAYASYEAGQEASISVPGVKFFGDTDTVTLGIKKG